MPKQREVLIIGGGISGVAVAYALQKRHIDYTLIEVKPKLGGAIRTVYQNGYIMDGGNLAHRLAPLEPILAELGLEQAVYPLDEERIAFAQGTDMLVQHLAKKLYGRIIQRMAVTSVGVHPQGTGYAICLENGLMLSAKRVVVAVSAPYAERIFRTLAPDVSEQLLNYEYDPIVRVSLGYFLDDMPSPTMPQVDTIVTDHPSRVPRGYGLMQVAWRIADAPSALDQVVDTVVTQLGGKPPIASFAHYWGESDPHTVTKPEWNPATLEQLLPAGVVLVGNCYRPHDLGERIQFADHVIQQLFT
ncbi:MAG: FAD-dependent oxidoreductase [Phototrophicaceae bacterium]